MKAGDLLLCVGMAALAAACGEESGSSGAIEAGGSGGSSSSQKDGSSAGSNAGAGQQTSMVDATMPVEDASGAGGGSTADAQSGDASEGGKVTASCATSAHPLCLDFESGKVDAPWTAPNNANAKVEEANAAHGRYAMHLSNLGTKPQLFVRTAMVPGIKDVMWGRFYLYMDPGAPAGHGALVRANDMQTNWYEVGFERNSYLGNWHVLPGGVPERYMRSKFVIPKKEWACVEFYFDGATPDMAKVWSDGTEVMFDDIAKTPTIQKAVQFTSFDIGIVFYHGTSLTSYEGNDAPAITDMWLDDIALDTKRIGCL